MNFLNELQEIIDKYPVVSKQELLDYLETNFGNIDDGGEKVYDFGKTLYWFSKRNLAVLINDANPTVQEFEKEEDKIKNLVYALENNFIKKA